MSSIADELTVSALIEAALAGDGDDDQAWAAIRALHTRGDQQVFDAAFALLRSPSAKARAARRTSWASWDPGAASCA